MSLPRNEPIQPRWPGDDVLMPFAFRVGFALFHDGTHTAIVQDAVDRIAKRQQKLELEVQRLREALQRYSMHSASEPLCEKVKGDGYHCTCGLDDLLEGYGGEG